MGKKIISYYLTESHIPDGMPEGTIITDDIYYEEYDNYNPTTKLYMHVEPNAVYNFEQYLIDNYSKYEYIFTYNKNVLDACPNAVKCLFGTSWIPKNIYESIDVSKKTCKVSSITGGKDWAIGHKFRHYLYDNQSNLSKDITWFVSSQYPVKDIRNNPMIHSSKFELFETFQFSIVIENSQQINYFTEKIIDCLITKTIPIYWGCPNVDEYFDTTGWIMLDTTDIESFKQKIQVITPEYYNTYSSVIENNYLKAIEYSDLKNNIKRSLTQIT